MWVWPPQSRFRLHPGGPHSCPQVAPAQISDVGLVVGVGGRLDDKVALTGANGVGGPHVRRGAPFPLGLPSADMLTTNVRLEPTSVEQCAPPTQGSAAQPAASLGRIRYKWTLAWCRMRSRVAAASLAQRPGRPGVREPLVTGRRDGMLSALRLTG